MKRISRCLFLAVVVAGLGCSHHKIEYKPGQMSTVNENKDGGLAATIHWLKNKDNAVDVFMTLTNNYDHDIFLDGGMRLTFNDIMGSRYQYAFPEVIRTKSPVTGVMVFLFVPNKPRVGTVRITIDPIYADAAHTQKLPPLKIEAAVK